MVAGYKKPQSISSDTLRLEITTSPSLFTINYKQYYNRDSLIVKLKIAYFKHQVFSIFSTKLSSFFGFRSIMIYDKTLIITNKKIVR